MASIVTGSNRGLGLSFIKTLLRTPIYNSRQIIAACRTPDQAIELRELEKASKNLHVLKLDVADFDSFPKFAEDVKQITNDAGVNLLINNAGISTKFTTIGLVKSQQLVDNFLVNTVGPIMLTKSLLPLLKTASEKNSQLPVGFERACVVNMSSILGSIGGNDKGGFYPYRCSKSALNAASKSMSVDLAKDKIMVIAMHPGWVKTDMGGKQAPLDTETSISGIIKTLQGLGEKDNGSFYQYNGEKIPW